MAEKYLYRLVSNVWRDKIEANIADKSYWHATNPLSDWRWYKFTKEEAEKLPNDGGVPYLKIDDEFGGFGLYEDPMAELDIEKDGLVWIKVN